MKIPADHGKTWMVWLLFVGFWLTFMIVFRSQPFNDPGSLWHVRVGSWIFDNGTFPRTDPFTWSYEGKFWIPQQWGAECAMALGHQFGGYDALLVLMGVLIAGMAAWIGRRFLETGLHPLPTAAIISLGMATAGFHFYLRPHLATIVLMAVVMDWLVDLDRRRVGVNHLILLIPLCVFWTNVHGGVLGGIVTFGIAIVGWAIVRSRTWHEIGILWLILLACLLATLMNPFGFDMHRTWFRIVGSTAMKENVPEHFPLSLLRSDGQAVVGFGLFYVFMLAGTLPKRPRVTWLIPLVWLGLSITSIRHGPLFVVVALVALADMLPETRWFRLLKENGDTFVGPPSIILMGWRGWVPISTTPTWAAS
ncbi:MAG: hypothetical protein K8T89_02555 [Planctomycetes bacterium]|nr:hypothetical protein [Planctomycetota bacterium]